MTGTTTRQADALRKAGLPVETADLALGGGVMGWQTKTLKRLLPESVNGYLRRIDYSSWGYTITYRRDRRVYSSGLCRDLTECCCRALLWVLRQSKGKT